MAEPLLSTPSCATPEDAVTVAPQVTTNDRLSSTSPVLRGTHIYSELLLADRQIRLLWLKSGQVADPIQCRLVIHSVDHEGCFEALSYVWGDRSAPQYISLNGSQFSVTANLHTALQYLRLPQSDRVLWVDAICIDQSSVEERNRQVALMSSIYAGATSVLCWLGSPEGDGIVIPSGKMISIEQALSRVSKAVAVGPNKTMWKPLPQPEKKMSKLWLSLKAQMLVSAQHEDDAVLMDMCLDFVNADEEAHPLHSRLGGNGGSIVQNMLAAMAFIFISSGHHEGEDRHCNKIPLFEDCSSSDRSKLRVATRFEEAFKALSTLVGSAWWDRVWTVQEACLAKDLYLVHYHVSIPFQLLEHAVYWFNQHAIRCCEEELATLPEGQKSVLRRFIKKVNEIKALRDSGDSGKFYPLKLSRLLSLYRSRKAEDPRDQIYGLLGISTWDRAEPLKADYSMSKEQTFIQTTMRLIQEEGSLNVLQATVGKSQNKTLPSWVQDWSEPCTDGRGFNTIESHILYNTENVQFKADLCCDSILKVSGVEVDTITSIGRICTIESSSEFVSIMKEWESMVAAAAPGLHGTYINGQAMSEAFRRTLGGDMVRQTRSLSRGLGSRPPDYYRVGDFPHGRRTRHGDESDEDVSRDWWFIIVEDEFPDVEIKEAWHTHFRTVVMQLVEHNKFFLTEKGLMGIGPASMAIGDKVFMLRGAQLPFILRHSNDIRRENAMCHHPTKLCFDFIGTSYVHGIMDGEAFQNAEGSSEDVCLC